MEVSGIGRKFRSDRSFLFKIRSILSSPRFWSSVDCKCITGILVSHHMLCTRSSIKCTQCASHNFTGSAILENINMEQNIFPSCTPKAQVDASVKAACHSSSSSSKPNVMHADLNVGCKTPCMVRISSKEVAPHIIVRRILK